jgi:hypothetical protein
MMAEGADAKRPPYIVLPAPRRLAGFLPGFLPDCLLGLLATRVHRS